LLLRTESYKTGILISTFLNILGKGVVFLNSLLIAYLFGSNENTDIYFYTLTTINLVCGYINGIDLLVIIPESMRIRERHGKEGEMRYLNFFIRLYACIGVAIALLILASPVFFYNVFSGFGGEMLQKNILILTISALIIPLQLVTNLLVSILASHKFFSMPILVSLVNNILCIVFFLLLKNQLHVAAGIIAIGLGFCINLGLLLYLFRQKLQWRFSGKINFPSFKNWRDIGIMELNILPITVRASLTYFLLSGLGTGVLTTLNYSNQLVMIPEMLILQQIAAVIGIKITELSAQDKEAELNRLFLNTMNFLMFILIPICFYMVLFSGEISEILYLRGSMTKENIEQIAMVISLLILLLPAKAYCDFFVTRVITARQRLGEVIGVTILMHVLILALIYISIKWYGLYGYLVAMLASYWIISNTVFYFILKKVAPFIDQLKFFRRALLLLLVNAVILSLLYSLRLWIGDRIDKYILLPAGFILYVFSLLFLNKKFQLDSSISELLTTLARRLPFKAGTRKTV
jgi:putative peptidoglycan lipid II flippase